MPPQGRAEAHREPIAAAVTGVSYGARRVGRALLLLQYPTR
ncbi:hypothetical protein ACIQMP_10765 [Streptomyces sp. NPDC091385]